MSNRSDPMETVARRALAGPRFLLCSDGAGLRAAPTPAAARSPMRGALAAPDAPTVVPLEAGYKIAPLDTLSDQGVQDAGPVRRLRGRPDRANLDAA